MTSTLLFLAYFLVATPIGLARRLIKDPLSRRRNRRATTYWTAIQSPVRQGGRAPTQPGRPTS